MFDHYRKNHFYNESMQKYENHSHYYKEDAIHCDRRNYFCQDYTSFSNANSYNYGLQPTSNNSKCFENSYQDQPFSTYSYFVPQNTYPHSRSSDFYSTPNCNQVDNTLLEFIREMQEENKISRKRIEENWAFLEEMKLEMENFRSEQEMEVFQKNSEFHGRKGWQYEGEREIHQGGKLLNVFDEKINAMECTDLIHDVKVSHENVINHIPLTFLNENLCLKNISFLPFMIHENNINEENLEPIIIKIYFTDWHDHLPNSKIFYMNVMILQSFMFNNSMLLSYILKKFLFTKWHDHFIEHEIISPIDIHSICPCFSYEFSLAQLKHKNSFRESYHYFMEYKNILFLKSSCIGAHHMTFQSDLIMLWAYICIKFSMKYKFIYMGIELLIFLCGFLFFVALL